MQDVIANVPPHWREGTLEEHGSRHSGQASYKQGDGINVTESPMTYHLFFTVCRLFAHDFLSCTVAYLQCNCSRGKIISLPHQLINPSPSHPPSSPLRLTPYQKHVSLPHQPITPPSSILPTTSYPLSEKCFIASSTHHPPSSILPTTSYPYQKQVLLPYQPITLHPPSSPLRLTPYQKQVSLPHQPITLHPPSSPLRLTPIRNMFHCLINPSPSILPTTSYHYLHYLHHLHHLYALPTRASGLDDRQYDPRWCQASPSERRAGARH